MPAAARRPTMPRMPSSIRRALPAVALALLLAAAACRERGESGADPAAGATYVDSAGCAECHPAAQEAWSGSHHDLAMQVADETSVLGDFDDAVFDGDGVRARFFRRDGRFFVHTAGPDGAPADFEITHTFGVEPLQQYLVPLPGGRLQCLTIAWDTERGRWFSLQPGEDVPPGDPFHWTGLYQRWNLMCAECHSTALERRYDPASGTYDTRFAEIDVACQACHGPGSLHVEWARAYAAGEEPDTPARGLTVDFASGDARYQVEACAPCHARRAALDAVHVPGRPLLEGYVPELLRPGLYYPDGQVAAEVYVYGSFAQSRMYAAGVRCTDCHDPHSLGLVAEGNALCVQCHSETPPTTRFPALVAQRYDTPEHHFHEPGSPGSACVDCHMPATTFMVVDPRRDHGFRVPRPDLAAELGTPDACTGCHADESAAWAAERIAEQRASGSAPRASFAAALAAARTGRPEAEAALVALVRDQSAAAIVRATAVEMLAAFGADALEALVDALDDEHPLVRAAAVRALGEAPLEARYGLLRPALDDSARLVRVAAAQALAELPGALWEAEGGESYAQARAELVRANELRGDDPSAHLNLGVLYQAEKRTADAIAAYEAALRLDPAFLPAVLNLVHSYDAAGRDHDALRLLEGALVTFPREGQLHYSLGLLLVELDRAEDAVESLRAAAALLPAHPRVRYNLGLLLGQLGRDDEAEVVLRDALSLAPADPDVRFALATFYADRERWADALPHAQRLAELVPDAPGPKALVERIRAALGR